MIKQQYSVQQYHISTILEWVRSGQIAIPEIQRPFVWKTSKVRDLLDSLYQGFPVGYLITWISPNIRLKDGSTSMGRTILIDGQQRVTALTAALLGQKVMDSSYQRRRIRIAFHPIEERFEVANRAIEKDNAWITDIAPLLSGEVKEHHLVEDYIQKNGERDRDQLFDVLGQLRTIMAKEVGVIQLNHDLDIETVTEIFIRINSKGVVLSQADFAMSKIAASEQYDGPNLRKLIDYFSHLAIAPDFYETIAENDKEFAVHEDFSKIAWLRKETEDLYDPDYNDVLRVAFITEFNRGRLSHLVSLLSGRNFEARTFEEEIAAESFARLRSGVLRFVNESNFKKFLMIIRSAGFIDPSMIRSQNALNFAYAFYLKLKDLGVPQEKIESAVRKWFAMSLLTSRYSGTPETTFEEDIRMISSRDVGETLALIEAGELSNAYWEHVLVQQLETSQINNATFQVFLAAQCKLGYRGFLSKEIKVYDLITFKGDVHHIFPKDYLKRRGHAKQSYNQVANFVMMQSEINIKVGNKAPADYFSAVREQCQTGESVYGGIRTIDDLQANLTENAIPEIIFEASEATFSEFLNQRRILMAEIIRQYYHSL